MAGTPRTPSPAHSALFTLSAALQSTAATSTASSPVRSQLGGGWIGMIGWLPQTFVPRCQLLPGVHQSSENQTNIKYFICHLAIYCRDLQCLHQSVWKWTSVSSAS